MNIFALATRSKFRFPSARGQLSVEQLWDVPLRSKDGFDLDAIAKMVNGFLKAATEESFVQPVVNPAKDVLTNQLEVVVFIIETKLAEETAREKSAINRAKKARLLDILAEKQAGALSALSEEELAKQIAALD